MKIVKKENLPKFIKFFLTEATLRWFALCSLIVVVDLAIFYLLSSQGISIFLSNFISSGLAVTCLYIISVRFVFKDKEYSYFNYVLFVCYYISSISFFSFCISFLVSEFTLVPIVAKIISLFFAFFINYYFVSKIV